MAGPWRDRLVWPAMWPSFAELLTAAVVAVVGAGAWYLIALAVFQSPMFNALALAPWGPLVAALLGAAAGIAITSRDILEKMAARRRTAIVDSELRRVSQESGPGAVASVSATAVAERVLGVRGDKESERLVEQRKQYMLLDEKALQPELRYLVKNWHPLPRDIKRMLNRFYVSLLIAYNRHLLTGEQPVLPMQLAKWLVLSERWPHLGRVLAAGPDAFKALESLAESPSQRDEFKKKLTGLAPSYAEDEELRKLIGAQPPLADVLERLVYQGAARPVEKTAEPVAQRPTAGRAAAS